MNAGTTPNGELSPLKRAFLALEETQARLEEVERARTEPLAIVGLGCRFPGADGPDAFWQLLRDGVDAIREVPADRWDVDAYYDPDPDRPGTMSTRWGGFLDAVDRFDPQFFGIAPREAISMDPQQRLVLEVCWEALEHAGQAPDRLAGSRTGVYVAISAVDYASLQFDARGLTGLDTYYGPGIAHSIASGRLSYVLGLNGPSISIDTACSSSLVAVHLACQSLRGGECRLALAGGVNLMLSPERTITLTKYHVMAPDGRCKAFDARANGFVRGEGCGFVVLKRLSDALADGDRILAVIRGTAVNQDGASSGLTAPNGPAQEAVIRDALANGRIRPQDVSYVEAHGTGTALGDPIEMRALGAVLGPGRAPTDPFLLGSVKTNIGHLESVAGVAGLIKTVLALQHGEIPPSLHWQTPNPLIAWEDIPVAIPVERTPWPRRQQPRIAGVSSFGMSGTNAHVVLEEAPPEDPPAPTGADRPSHLLTLSAKSPAALRALAERYAARLGEEPTAALADIAYSANTGRAHLPHRVAVRADNLAQLQTQLTAAAADQPAPRLHRGEVREAPKVAFLFSGQGAQVVGMGHQLYQTQPTFRAAIDRCAALLAPYLDRPLADLLAPDAPADLLTHTAYTQPALFAVEYALAELWRSWGVVPGAVLGHSLGEYTAACVAGALELEDALRLVAARGRLMGALPPGGRMLAVRAPAERVAAAIEPYRGDVALAAINGPRSVVVAGANGALAAVEAVLVADGIEVQPLAVSHAFHSPLMEPMLAALEAEAAAVPMMPPRLRWISNLTGAPWAPRTAPDATYWRRQAREPVQFQAGIAALWGQGYQVFVEIGPRPTLVGMGAGCVPAGGGTWLPSLRPGREDWAQLLDTLGALYVGGVPVDWAGFDRDYVRRRVPLPTYPFQRQRYWFTDAPAPPLPRQTAPAANEHPLLGRRLRSPLQDRQFEVELAPSDLSYVQDHQVFGLAILPAAGFMEMALAAAAKTLPAGVPVVERLGIGKALAFPDGAPRTVQVVVGPTTDRTAEFRVCSIGAGERDWATHASGAIASLPDYTAEEAPPAVMLDEVRARCAQQVTADAHYAHLRERGLAFGPSLQGVAEIWRREGEALGRLALPDRQASELTAYQFHPSLLDACMQVVAMALPQTAGTYLPLGVDRLRLYGAPAAAAWSYARLRPGPTAAGASTVTLTLDVQIVDERGRVLAALEGLAHKRAEARDLGLPAPDPAADWLYEVAWEPKARPVPAAPAARCARPDEIAAAVERRGIATDEQQRLSVAEEGLRQLDTLCAAYIVQALRDLGWTPQPGERVSVDALRAQLGVVERYGGLLARFLEILAEDGQLARDGDAWLVARPAQAVDLAGQQRALATAYRELGSELTLAERCGTRLAEVLRGTVDPLALLFPGGSVEIAERLYRESPFAQAYNSRVGEAVAAALARRAPAGPIRVLEIGAGTGGTTSYVLPRLPADRTEYVFTDVSALLLARAREKFADSPFVRYRLLDIEQDPVAQGFAPHEFDVVVAANVLHATVNLAQTLEHTARLLAPGGVLILQEMTGRQRWVDLSFGLTDGWWRFGDRDRRPRYPLLGRDAWLDLLAERGFDAPRALARPSGSDGTEPAQSEQTIVVAGAPTARDVEGTQTPRAETSPWLILADRGGVGDALAASLRQCGQTAWLVHSGDRYAAVGPHAWQIDPADPAHFARLWNEMRAASGQGVAGVVHLWSLDAPASDPMTLAALDRAQQHACGSALSLVQALVGDAVTIPPRLWLVTRGAQAVQPADGLAPAQAGLWGLGKVIALEHPELRCVRLDLDPAAADATPDLLAELMAPDDEDQVALRAGTRYAPRLVRARLNAEPVECAPADEAPPVRLEIAQPGTLDGLSWCPMQRRPPGPGEVEIRVDATALNFMDVLTVLGMRPGDPGPLGGECVGRVVAVGADVQGFVPGDEVVALAYGSFATYVTVDAAFVARRPAGLTAEEAVTLPIPFATAVFALHHLGQMTAGERVLIHAAAGGVGLAAVQLAQEAGAEVFATAGSPEKRAFVASLGVRHVFDSRSLAFADEIRARTQGEGVDLVLNSLAGEFIPRSLSLLRANGRFLELGKRDYLTPAEIARLGDGIRYFAIDLNDPLRTAPELIHSILADTMAAAGAGTIWPLPRRVFPASEAPAAFRHMAQAKHIGKVVVAQPSAPAAAEARSTIRAAGTYLVVGGLRGLGLRVAEWLVERGARHLALMGRAAPTDEACAVLERLKRAGARVHVAQGDVSRPEDVERVLAEIAHTLPPLCGIVHSAGVLDDGALVQQDWARFRTVLAPKVAGAWNLHVATRDQRLDFFVLFSSLASLLGSAGQGNHAAANAFLDVLAHHRRAAGRPAVSINWGAWSETGAAAERGVGERIAGQGVGTIAPADGLALLGRLLADAPPQVGVTPIDWPTYLSRYARDGVPPFLTAFARELAPAQTVAPEPVSERPLSSRLAELPARKRPAMVLEYVRERAARVLGIARDALDAGKPLHEMGLDSLMAVELRNLLGSGLGLDRSLPATLVFEYPTVQGLADYLCDVVLSPTLPSAEPDRRNGAGRAATDDGGPAADLEVTAALAAVEGLTDDEVDRLFADQLKGER